MSGLDHHLLRRAPGLLALGALLALAALPACGPRPTGGAIQTGPAPAPGAAQVEGQPALDAAALEQLAATAELDLPGELVRSGRYLYGHSDIDGGFVTTMAEDFALARVPGGHAGKARIHPIQGYGTPAVVAFALDPSMRLRSLVWRCECEAPLLHLEAGGGQLVITSIRDGARETAATIPLSYEWTLTQFQVLSWAMIGSADLEPRAFRTWHLVDIDEGGQASLYGSIVLTRHAEKPMPEPGADEPAARFYTAEPLVDSAVPDAEADPEPDPPEQIWTDALGCPLLTLDESAGPVSSVWRIELVPLPPAGAAAPASPAAGTRVQALTAAGPLPELDAAIDAALAGEAAQAGDATQAPCPPATPQPHCVLFTLHPRAAARASEFVALAARDGIEVQREGDLWSTYLADPDIVRHFGGRVVYRRLPASASSAGRASAQCNAYLEGVEIPARYARYLAGISVGHQICE